MVAVVKLSVVGVGYAAVVETVVGLITVIEAIRPSITELERVFDMYLVVGGYLPMLLHCPILIIFLIFVRLLTDYGLSVI